MLLYFVVDQIRVIHVRPEGHRPVGVQCRVGVLALAQELAHGLRVVKAIDPALLMAGEKTVVGDDDRQTHVGMFADSHRGKIHVVGGLRIAREQNDPAGVQHEVNVRMVATDVEGPGHRARRDVQYHRHSRARLHWQLLKCVQQSLRRRCVQHSATAQRRSVADTRGAVFTVGWNHDNVVLAVRLHLRQALCHFGRRSNREIAHEVEADVARGQCGGFVAALEVAYLANRFCSR